MLLFSTAIAGLDAFKISKAHRNMASNLGLRKDGTTILTVFLSKSTLLSRRAPQNDE